MRASVKLKNLKQFWVRAEFIERWGKYWQNLYLDYKEVATNILKDIRNKPLRATIYISISGCLYYVGQHNPDESSYRDQLMRNEAKLLLVGKAIRNPITEEYITRMQQCYNEGIVRRLNLGVFSLIWLDNFERGIGLYKATCSYLQPRYLTFYERIIDVGFMDKWWWLEQKMHDYDVNEAEFMTQ